MEDTMNEQTQDLEMSEDLTSVPLATDNVPEGQYSFRISKVEKIVDQTTGRVDVQFSCKVQTEGEAFGRSVNLRCDMGDPRGLSNLKTLYKACGYQPQGGGHNPTKILDGEFRATVKHKLSQKDGVTYANIAPWTIKSILG